MSMILALGLMALSPVSADGTHHHRTTIEHRGVPVGVTYRATMQLKTRPIGMSPPTRPSTARCTWVATVVVERQMLRDGQPAPGLSRVVSSDLELKGNRPGGCTGAGKAIARDIAARDEQVRAHVLAVAERDRSILLAELEAAAPSAS